MRAWKVYLAGAVVLFACGLFFIFSGDKSHAVLWLAERRHPPVDYFLYYATVLGEWPAFVIAGLWFWLHSWRKMLTVPLLGGLVTLCAQLLKRVFLHERPLVYLQRLDMEIPAAVLDYQILTGHASFPSGHSTAAWALLTLVAAMERKTWVSVACLVLAASASVSRVYLVAHFLQDVVAGAAIGFLLGYTMYYVYETRLRRNNAGIPAA